MCIHRYNADTPTCVGDQRHCAYTQYINNASVMRDIVYAHLMHTQYVNYVCWGTLFIPTLQDEEVLSQQDADY